MITLIESFFNRVKKKEVEIYNEFSLQHELGVHLRSNMSPSKIEFERPVTFFKLKRSDFVKAEIDICVYRNQKAPDAAIELKFPRAGQYPEQMFSSLRDICFLEQLVMSKFSVGYFVFVADDPWFYSGRSNGIYRFFRSGTAVTGQVFGPTGNKTRSVNISGQHRVHWKLVQTKMRYFVVPIVRTGK